MIGAYVEGLPIPDSSRDLMRLASLYLAGGSVKCWLVKQSSTFTSAPFSKLGKLFSSILDGQIFKKPSKIMVLPVARKIYLFFTPSTFTSKVAVSNFASGIWDAIKRLQIRLYRRPSSPATLMTSGVVDGLVGLMAS